MLTALTVFAASAALQSGAPVYDVEVRVQDKRGLFGTRSIKVSQEIPLRPGTFDINASDAVLLEGDIAINGDRVSIDMTICRPRQDPCEVIATPRLSFRMGADASIRETTLRSIWEVRFQPD